MESALRRVLIVELDDAAAIPLRNALARAGIESIVGRS